MMFKKLLDQLSDWVGKIEPRRMRSDDHGLPEDAWDPEDFEDDFPPPPIYEDEVPRKP